MGAADAHVRPARGRYKGGGGEAALSLRHKSKHGVMSRISGGESFLILVVLVVLHKKSPEWRARSPLTLHAHTQG
jgi:hypothetical protein